MEPGVHPARFIPELSLSASSVEQAKVGDRAAHTPTHGLYLQGETHGDSRSNRGTCLLIAFCGHALQSSKVRVRPISVIDHWTAGNRYSSTLHHLKITDYTTTLWSGCGWSAYLSIYLSRKRGIGFYRFTQDEKKHIMKKNTYSIALIHTEPA